MEERKPFVYCDLMSSTLALCLLDSNESKLGYFSFFVTLLETLAWVGIFLNHSIREWSDTGLLSALNTTICYWTFTIGMND